MKTPTLILLALVVSACEMPKTDPPEKTDMVASRELDALDEALLWQVIMIEIGKAGYYVDDEISDEGTGKFESLWVNQLAPFRYEGRRKKLVGMIEPSPGRQGAFRVLLITWVQRNADLEDPLNPAKAIWQNVEPDVGSTSQILYRIERRFRVIGDTGAGG